MEIIIIRIAITYFLIGTIILFNLLFNPRLTINTINIETKEIKPVSSLFLILFSLFWIILFPILLINRNKIEKE